MHKWTATWNGHTIDVEMGIGFGNYPLKLYADGKIIGQGKAVLTSGGEVRGELRNVDGTNVIIEAKQRVSFWGPRCHIFADGRFIGGDPI